MKQRDETGLLQFNGVLKRDPAIDKSMNSMQVNWEPSRIRGLT